MKAARVGVAVLGLGLVLPTACGRDPLLDPGGRSSGSGGQGGSGPLGGRGGTGAATGRGGTGGGPDAADANPPSDLRPGEFPLVVLPDDGPALPVGRSFRFRALVKLGQSGQATSDWRDLAAEPLLVWTIDDPLTAEITPKNGRVTGLRAGKTIVHARHPTFGSAQVPLLVTASELTQVALTPSPLRLMITQAQAVTATAVYADGSSGDVTQAAVWATGDQRVARVENGLPPIGQVMGQSAGNATISAEFAGKKGEISVVVSGTAPPTLTLTPIAASQTVGATSKFSAIFRQSMAPNSDVSAVASWSSGDAAVAMWLGPLGLFRCVGTGSTNVSAAYMGLMASAPLSCTMAAPTLKELRLSLPNNGPLIVAISYGMGVDAVASDGMSTPVTDGKAVRWTTSDPLIATIDDSPGTTSPTVLATLVGRAAGAVTVTATYRNVSTSQDYTFIAR